MRLLLLYSSLDWFMGISHGLSRAVKGKKPQVVNQWYSLMNNKMLFSVKLTKTGSQNGGKIVQPKCSRSQTQRLFLEEWVVPIHLTTPFPIFTIKIFLRTNRTFCPSKHQNKSLLFGNCSDVFDRTFVFIILSQINHWVWILVGKTSQDSRWDSMISNMLKIKWEKDLLWC